LVAVFADLPEVSALEFGQWSHGPVVDHQDINPPTAPARVLAVGWERNELVRVNGKWLIRVRDTQPDKE